MFGKVKIKTLKQNLTGWNQGDVKRVEDGRVGKMIF